VPVSGCEVGAKAGSFTIMCGGDPAVFEKMRPPLEKMGKNITLVGGDGDSQATHVREPDHRGAERRRRRRVVAAVGPCLAAEVARS